MNNNKYFNQLLSVIAELRNPEHGCPWDLKQTHETLLKYLLEESYEFIEACELKSPEKMEEEIGDVLLQVLLHSQIASESNLFNIESVSKTLADKLIRRHPHVFEKNHGVLTAEQVLINWEEIKKEEKLKANESNTSSRISRSVLNAPPLLAALKIGNKTKELKFDWENYQQVIYKVEEEWQELKEELTPHKEINLNRTFEELGDLLFSVVQLSRHLNLNPEEALKMANKKFLNRFHAMENLMEKDGVLLEDLNQEQMDVFWNQAKKHEKNKI